MIALNTNEVFIQIETTQVRSDYSHVTFAYTDPNPAPYSLHEQVEVHESCEEVPLLALQRSANSFVFKG